MKTSHMVLLGLGAAGVAYLVYTKTKTPAPTTGAKPGTPPAPGASQLTVPGGAPAVPGGPAPTNVVYKPGSPVPPTPPATPAPRTAPTPDQAMSDADSAAFLSKMASYYVPSSADDFTSMSGAFTAAAVDGTTDTSKIGANLAAGLPYVYASGVIDDAKNAGKALYVSKVDAVAMGPSVAFQFGDTGDIGTFLIDNAGMAIVYPKIAIAPQA